jgi:hypothetical protein
VNNEFQNMLKEGVVSYCKYCCGITLEGSRTSTKNLTTVGIHAKIRTGDLQNKSQTHFWLGHLVQLPDIMTTDFIYIFNKRLFMARVFYSVVGGLLCSLFF